MTHQGSVRCTSALLRFNTPLQRRVHVSPETKSPPGFPEGIAFYRGMAGTASISCRRFESEMSFRGHTAAQRPQETHLE